MSARSSLPGCTMVERSRNQTYVSLEWGSWSSTDAHGTVDSSPCVRESNACPGMVPLSHCELLLAHSHAKHTRRTIIWVHSITAPGPLSARVHPRILLENVDNGSKLVDSCAMLSNIPVEGGTAMYRCWNGSARRPHVCFLTMR